MPLPRPYKTAAAAVAAEASRLAVMLRRALRILRQQDLVATGSSYDPKRADRELQRLTHPADRAPETVDDEADRLAHQLATRVEVLARDRAATRMPLPLYALAERAKLDALAFDLFLLALAPEVDDGFGRVYQLLRGGSKRGLDVATAARILTPADPAAAAMRQALSPGGALYDLGLVELGDEGGQGCTMATTLTVAPSVVAHVLGQLVREPLLRAFVVERSEIPAARARIPAGRAVAARGRAHRRRGGVAAPRGSGRRGQAPSGAGAGRRSRALCRGARSHRRRRQLRRARSGGGGAAGVARRRLAPHRGSAAGDADRRGAQDRSHVAAGRVDAAGALSRARHHHARRQRAVAPRPRAVDDAAAVAGAGAGARQGDARGAVARLPRHGGGQRRLRNAGDDLSHHRRRHHAHRGRGAHPGARARRGRGWRSSRPTSWPPSTPPSAPSCRRWDGG